MRFPRMTTLWWLAAAVVVLACAATLILMDRSRRFEQIARQHSGPFPPLNFDDPALRYQSIEDFMASSQRVSAWHAELARKYERAARYPWLPVQPDPPPPENPVEALNNEDVPGLP